MLLAARSGADAPLPTADDISAFAMELVETGPRGRFMENVEPAAAGVLQQLFEYVDEQDEDATVQGAVWEWVMFGAQDSDGRPLVDRVIARLPRPLTEAERSALCGLHDSRYGLFTIDAFGSKDLAQVTDLLSTETGTGTETETETGTETDAATGSKSGADTLELHLESIQDHHEVGKTIACFVTRTQAGLEVVSGAWELPPGAETSLPMRLREVREESPLKDVPLPEFLTRLSIWVPLLLFEHFRDQESGDPNFPPPSF